MKKAIFIYFVFTAVYNGNGQEHNYKAANLYSAEIHLQSFNNSKFVSKIINPLQS